MEKLKLFKKFFVITSVLLPLSLGAMLVAPGSYSDVEARGCWHNTEKCGTDKCVPDDNSKCDRCGCGYPIE